MGKVYGFCDTLESSYYSFNLEYDTSGRVKNVAEYREGLGEISSNYQYDASNQVICEKGDIFSIDYGFDARGNITKIDGEEQDFNLLDQIKHSHGNNYCYDQNGFLTQKQCQSGDTYDYDFDLLGNLLSVFKNGEELVHYSYDPLGRRISQETSFEVTNFIYFGMEEVGSTTNFQELIDLKIVIPFEELSKKSFILEKKEETYVALLDFRNNVSVLISQAGEIIEQYVYSVFGQISSFDSYDEEIANSEINPYLFGSNRYSITLDLFFIGARCYDPNTGKWISPDPIGNSDDINLYRYCKNNPLLYCDPTGLFVETLKNVGRTLGSIVSGSIRGMMGITGFVMERLSFHTLPDIGEYLRPHLMRLGMMLQGRSSEHINGILKDLYRPEIVFIDDIGERELSYDVYPMNGINCTLEDFKETLCTTSKNNDNLKLIGIYNPSQGFSVNLMRCAFEKIGFVRPYTARLQEKVNARLEVRPDRSALFVCHSEGNYLMKEIYKNLPDQMEGRVRILGLGSPYIGRHPDFDYVASINDGVSLLNPLPMLGRFLDSRCSSVKRIMPSSWIPLCDHSFRSKGYQNAVSDYLRELTESNF